MTPLGLLGRRFWKSYFRNVPYNGTRFIFAIVLALLFGSILWNVGHKKCGSPVFSPFHGCPNLWLKSHTRQGCQCCHACIKHAMPTRVGRGRCRNTVQDVYNILGALYLSMLFLGIINSRTIQ